jgi:hypothetical protein
MSVKGLSVHSPDGGIITMEEAFAIPVPGKTSTYTPVSNQGLWEMLQRNAEYRGLRLGVPQMGISHKGQRLFGTVEILNQDHLDNQVRLMLGLRNSYDKTLSVGVCFGSKVFVCDNLCFTGYTSEDEDAVAAIHKRHHSDVWEGLQEKLSAAMDKFEIFKSYQDSFYTRLKENALTDAMAHHLIVESVRADAITAKDVMAVANEWAFQADGPKNEVEQEVYHPEFAPRNAWSLFNAFTEIHKGFQQKNPFEANIRSIKMNNFFKQRFLMN